MSCIPSITDFDDRQEINHDFECVPMAIHSRGTCKSFRLSDILKLLRSRYGGPCREPHAHRYLMAAIPELRKRARSWRLAVAFARDWAPNITEDEVQDAWLLVAKRRRPNLTSDQLARLLRVRDDEPRSLNLRCIPAMSRKAKDREADDRARRKQAESDRRSKRPGYTPRTASKAATKPWEAEGMSRSAWYAKRKADRLDGFVPVLDGFVPSVSVDPFWTVSCPSVPLTVLTDSALSQGTTGTTASDQPSMPSLAASAELTDREKEASASTDDRDHGSSTATATEPDDQGGGRISVSSHPIDAEPATTAALTNRDDDGTSTAISIQAVATAEHPKPSLRLDTSVLEETTLDTQARVPANDAAVTGHPLIARPLPYLAPMRALVAANNRDADTRAMRSRARDQEAEIYSRLIAGAPAAIREFAGLDVWPD